MTRENSKCPPPKKSQMPRYHFSLILLGLWSPEFRSWAKRSKKPVVLGSIYSGGLLGWSLLKWIFPALSNSKQLLTALGHNSVCLSAFTYQYSVSHWMHRLKQYWPSWFTPSSKTKYISSSHVLLSFVSQKTRFGFSQKKDLVSVITDLAFSIHWNYQIVWL